MDSMTLLAGNTTTQEHNVLPESRRKDEQLPFSSTLGSFFFDMAEARVKTAARRLSPCCLLLLAKRKLLLQTIYLLHVDTIKLVHLANMNQLENFV